MKVVILYQKDSKKKSVTIIPLFSISHMKSPPGLFPQRRYMAHDEQRHRQRQADREYNQRPAGLPNAQKEAVAEELCRQRQQRRSTDDKSRRGQNFVAVIPQQEAKHQQYYHRADKNREHQSPEPDHAIEVNGHQKHV